jgi:hypothetical protein
LSQADQVPERAGWELCWPMTPELVVHEPVLELMDRPAGAPACSWDGRLSTRLAAASTAIASAVWVRTRRPVFLPRPARKCVWLAFVLLGAGRRHRPSFAGGSRWFVEVNVVAEQERVGSLPIVNKY